MFVEREDKGKEEI